MTQFVPPYDGGNNPVERPVIVGAGATTIEEAAADAPNGLLQLYTEADVTLAVPGICAAYTGAKPYLEQCFITPKHKKPQPYTVTFTYAYEFGYELQGGLDLANVGGLVVPIAIRTSTALIEAVGEVVTARGLLVGAPAHDDLLRIATNGGPGIGPANAFQVGRTILSVNLQGNTTYHWRFTYHAEVQTVALGLVAKNYAYVNSEPVALGPAGGGNRHYPAPAPRPPGGVKFRTLLLAEVDVSPDVLFCPDSPSQQGGGKLAERRLRQGAAPRRGVRKPSRRTGSGRAD